MNNLILKNKRILLKFKMKKYSNNIYNTYNIYFIFLFFFVCFYIKVFSN